MRVRLIVLVLLLLPLWPPYAGAAPRWEFTLDWPDEAQLAQLRACSQAEQAEVTLHSEGGAAYLRAMARDGGKPPRRRGDHLIVRDWRAGDCIEARIDLRAAGRADRFGLGYREGQFLRVSPLRWLWRPQQVDPDSRLRLLRLPPGWLASLPWAAQPDGSHRLGATPGDWPAVTAFGRFTEHRVALPGGALRVARLPLAEGEAATQRWLEAVAGDLLQAYGRLPLVDAQVLVVPLPGVQSAVPWGQVTRGGGSAVHLFIGAEAGYAGWRADWTATHEFAHLLHPFMGDAGRWLGEGLASYYQNVLRARSGALSAEEAWEKLRAGFERGRRATPDDALPLADAAMSRQRGSTMRIYWAGAAFWLESDLHLRRHGDSLDRVLGEFAARHLPAERRWTPEAFMAALHAIAPAGAWDARLQAYATARRFPDTAALVASAQTTVDAADAGPWAAAIMRPAPVAARGP